MIVVYPGCFDPITYGHMDIISRALNIFDSLIVAIPSSNNEKCGLLSVEQRQKILELIYTDNSRVKVEIFDGLLVNWMLEHNFRVLVRGIRDSVDMANEWRMAHCNQVLCNEVETLFFASSPNVSHISSTLVRQIISCNGDISQFVPAAVVEILDQ